MAKDDMLLKISNDTSVKVEIVELVFESLIDNLVDKLIVGKKVGNKVNIKNLGTFEIKKHKGHPIGFENGRKESSITDYAVVKFKPTKSFTDKVRANINL